MKYFLLAIPILLFLFACKSQKPFVFEEYDGPKLVFGSAGGFAGTVLEYVFLPNGKIYRKKNMSKMTECQGIDEKVAKQLFENYHTLKIGEMQMDDPGNMTYFIAMEDGDKKSKIVWGANPHELDRNLRLYGRNLKLLVKNQNPVK